MSQGSHEPTIEHLRRELAPQVLGAIARRHGDFAAAEDAVQEALIAAALQWPEAGVVEKDAGGLVRRCDGRIDGFCGAARLRAVRGACATGPGD